MRFAQWQYINFLWIVPALTVFLVWALRKRQSDLKRFAGEGLIGALIESVNFRRRNVKRAFLVVAIVLSVLALMRPQWGFQWHEVKRRGLDILVAIDTSKIMLSFFRVLLTPASSSFNFFMSSLVFRMTKMIFVSGVSVPLSYMDFLRLQT